MRILWRKNGRAAWMLWYSMWFLQRIIRSSTHTYKKQSSAYRRCFVFLLNANVEKPLLYGQPVVLSQYLERLPEHDRFLPELLVPLPALSISLPAFHLFHKSSSHNWKLFAMRTAWIGSETSCYSLAHIQGSIIRPLSILVCMSFREIRVDFM